ncbi:hypothetical protein MM1S1540310_3036 [Mycobacteroides abscessus subsp. bolletii 1S-154-0310]|uniref:hypothetical protein n=1 Tax=Mycobacteroides abscessus TaxID=36809 RepID=UPI00026826FA|nr:hypothetical protein [Mycobacteroides abscessus]WJJ55661.1 hypothetical protein PROPHIT481_40 [Mycobacterium phage prophiT48-1]WJJ55848.1 hypothetical protein PROPHIT361_40 [Mycobacterium phage prophiT36-1]EIU63140.1 hypothetical protein MM1S1510930_3479 [Mycobacteroides abscessus subsp. bolletii 1S-151-0930]EIU69248.1 hypothetical protein MM1S1520914_3685 [Mycobacteroides abscessus subsp. bolletii 1S-152-0914]EIU73719.1 hypothetical protein MM1S1530915_3028 [Mycobacteroides abscessus subsp
MADSDLTKETRQALLTAIKETAPNATASGLHELASAFALTVGAYPQQLPG